MKSKNGNKAYMVSHPTVSRGSCAHGFTLIELLVVITILILLMALMFPGLKRARGAAHVARCVNNMRMLGASVMQYAADHNGLMPRNRLSEGTPGHTALADAYSLRTNWNSGWGYLYREGYIDDPSILYCPGTPRSVTQLQYNAYRQPWGEYSHAQSQGGVGSVSVHTGYYYLPYNEYRPLDRVRSYQIPPDRVLAIENFGFTRSHGANHYLREVSWAAVHMDGSARMYANQALYKDFPAGQIGWGGGGGWATFQNIRDRILHGEK